MYFYNFILILCLILSTVILWLEFNGLILKIFKNNNFKKKVLIFFIRLIFFVYLIFFSCIIWISFSSSDNSSLKLFTLYTLGVCVVTDIGGLIFGKTFKGKKLTKISPNKTISGSVGSFILSLFLMFIYFFNLPSVNLILLTIFTLSVCLCSQIGDLFISYLKRKAKVKDTSNLLPGHGGLLDRLDGILFGLPFGFIIMSFII